MHLYMHLYTPIEPEIQVKFEATDVERRHEQQKYILSVLLEDAEADPKNTRAWLFIASTAAVLGNLTLSVRAYTQLAAVTSWDEERYQAKFELGKALLLLHGEKSFPAVLTAMLDAHASLPGRAPAVHWLAQHYYNKGDYTLAYTFALYLRDIKLPSNMFMSKSLS
jgi:cytochrome c-type biogenesis protein CcmH/NrfG